MIDTFTLIKGVVAESGQDQSQPQFSDEFVVSSTDEFLGEVSFRAVPSTPLSICLKSYFSDPNQLYLGV